MIMILSSRTKEAMKQFRRRPVHNTSHEPYADDQGAGKGSYFSNLARTVN